jgi:hypothetical protein
MPVDQNNPLLVALGAMPPQAPSGFNWGTDNPIWSSHSRHEGLGHPCHDQRHAACDRDQRITASTGTHRPNASK